MNSLLLFLVDLVDWLNVNVSRHATVPIKYKFTDTNAVLGGPERRAKQPEIRCDFSFCVDATDTSELDTRSNLQQTSVTGRLVPIGGADGRAVMG